MTDDCPAYLALLAWDVERWFGSDTYLSQPLAVQAAYLNLCFRAYQRQPTCTLPDDDALLSRASGATLEEWKAIKLVVFSCGGWVLTESGWTHPTVLETYQESAARHTRAIQSGRIAGKASARVRRELSKNKGLGTTVQRPFNDRSTTVDPPSPSPSPSPYKQKRNNSLAASPPSWSHEACDLWIARFGGTAPGGKIGKALKPLVEKHTWEVVREAWRSYLQQVEADYVSPAHFAQTFGRWTGERPDPEQRSLTRVEGFMVDLMKGDK